MAGKSHNNNPSSSVSFQAQSYYDFGKRVLSTYRDLHDNLNWPKAKDDAEPVFLFELLSFALENTVMCMSQGLEVLWQYPNAMRIFS